jgi:hypothetical protein
MIKIVWTASAIEALNALGEFLVELAKANQSQSQRRKRKL